MSSPTHDPDTTVRSDREYYAELWGTNPAALRRAALRRLRMRSGFVAALAGLLLAAQVAWTSLSEDANPRLEIGPASASGQSPAIESEAEAKAPRKLTSSMVSQDAGAD